MSRRTIVISLCVVILAFTHLAEAQQAAKVPRIGYLDNASSSVASVRIESFLQGLRDLGWVDRQNIAIEFRYAEGKPDRLAELAAELVRLKPDVIVVQSNTVARAVSIATKTIPIVMADGGDPVAGGLVASLARPGGNITGLTNLSAELGTKRLELLKEIVPRLARVAVLPSPGGSGLALKEMQAVAPSLKIQLHILEVRVAADLERAFKGAANARAGALAVMVDPTGLLAANRKQILEIVVKNRLPAIYPFSSWVNAGGLMSYAADQLESYRRAATYVDKILKGRKPADLPVEQPMKFEFIINLKAAKQIGLTIPPNVLVRADKVIR